MEGKEVLKRTWLDARTSIGVYPLSVFKCILLPIVWVIGQVGNVIYVFYKHGKPDGMTEIFLIAWPTGVFLAALLCVLFWNLWLAPHKLVCEKINGLSREKTDGVDKGKSSQKQAILRDMEELLENEITRYDPSQYQDARNEAKLTCEKLKLRYNLWFPESLRIDLQMWIHKIVKTIQENPIEVACKKIKKAASEGSWENV